MIVIVDYGLGNVGSIRNMFTRCGATSIVSGEVDDVLRATKLVLPGVGSFDTGMSELEASGLRPALDKKVMGEGTPVLGICLGMQMLGRGSQEGTLPGLGWLAADAVAFAAPHGSSLKVPHMGWREVRPRVAHPLFAGLGGSPAFYFSHSFHARTDEAETVVATTTYGDDFPSVLQHDNVLGVQFHPEKSHAAGVSLFRNFAEHA